MANLTKLLQKYDGLILLDTETSGLDAELEAFDWVAEAVKEIARALMEALKPAIDWALKTAERFIGALAAGIVPRKWLHLAKHAKKARTRKKYHNRIRRAVFAALAAEWGGSS